MPDSAGADRLASVADPLPPKFISPSRIARFYYLECERYLRYGSVTKGARGEEGVPDPPYDTEPSNASDPADR